MTINNLDNFETKRLSAERLRECHLEQIHLMHQDEKVMAYLGSKRSLRETEEYMELNLAHWEKYGYGIWILHDIETSQFAGRGGLRNTILDGKEETEIAYGLMPEYWNRGLATEFTNALVRIGFTDLSLSSLVSITISQNIASQRVLEKTDFHYEKDITFKGKNHMLYRIHKSEYI